MRWLLLRVSFYWIACLVSKLCLLVSNADPLSLQVDGARLNQIQLIEAAGDVWTFETTGEDPYLFLKPFSRSANDPENVVLSFDYFCPDGISELEIFFGPPIRAGASLTAGGMMKSESWIPFSVNLSEQSGRRWTSANNQLRLDFGRKPGVRIGIRHLNLRPPNADEAKAVEAAALKRAVKIGKAESIKSHYRRDYPTSIESIALDLKTITFRIPQHPKLSAGARLIEISIEWQPGEPIDPLSVIDFKETDASGAIVQTLSRWMLDRDRITSRWAVALPGGSFGWRLQSLPQYINILEEASEHALDRKAAGSLKGMGGVWANEILDELVDLGVRHITDNMLISEMLSSTKRAGWEETQYQGTTWWVNPGFISQHDRLIRFATQHDMVVSAIILVGFGDSGFAGKIMHPEAERAGHYAMPNFSSREGVLAYGAAMDFLTRRYAQPGDPYGRVSNWIMHNEIDYGWVWTNMGKQPMEVYMDVYVRSMRLTHLLARRYNPHARVFISLTHHWNAEPDPSWKTYAPRRMLDWLAKVSRLEGDFEWGLAYHPYPQSLWNPQAWNDTLPTFDFETPLITPKNLEVLDAYMRQPHMLFEGEKVRGVILSEQGYHTPIESDMAQSIQAAAFVYTWHKIRPLHSIEAFHNHRWVDHPHEGGLLLGLRSLPSKEHPYGLRKKAWETFRILETSGEMEATQFAKEIVGVDSFEEIPWKREIP